MSHNDEQPLFSSEFILVVRLLRALPERHRHYAHFAANYWPEDYLAEAEQNGDLPGRPGDLPVPPHLKVIQ